MHVAIHYVQLPSSSYNHNTLTTLRTSFCELQMHLKVIVRTFHAPNASRLFPHRCSEEEIVVTLWYGRLIAQGTQGAVAQLLLQPQYTDNPQNIIL